MSGCSTAQSDDSLVFLGTNISDYKIILFYLVFDKLHLNQENF